MRVVGELAIVRGAVAQITANWEKFFNASTPLSQRVALLQNGSSFSSAINAFSKLPELAKAVRNLAQKPPHHDTHEK